MNRKLRRNALGEALRTAREQAGISQVPLSLALGYEYNVVSTWENGSKPFHAREWPLLCAAVPGLDPSLSGTHADELALDEGRKLKPRPPRLDPKVTAVLNAVVALKVPGRVLTEVAAEIGLDYVAFWKMLKGKASPTLSQLVQLADYFELDTDQLLGRRPVEGAPYVRLVELVGTQKTRINELEKELARARQLNDLLLAEKEAQPA